MNRISLSTVAVLSLGLIGMTACVGAAPGATPDQFAQADSNHDGRLNSEEYQRLLAIQAAGGNAAAAQAEKANLRHQAHAYRSLDTNHDGYISRSEAGL